MELGKLFCWIFCRSSFASYSCYNISQYFTSTRIEGVTGPFAKSSVWILTKSSVWILAKSVNSLKKRNPQIVNGPGE